MTASGPCRSIRALPSAAFTIVESLISIIVVGGLVVAALNTVGAATAGRKSSGDRAIARLLAQDLMAEILTKAYEDPGGAPVFGPEAGETTFTRAAFDDVDDYHAWSSSPKYRDGTDWPGLADWRRAVTVEYVAPTDVSAVMVTDSGVKRVVVLVENRGRALTTLTAVRTMSADVVSANLMP